MMEAIKAVEMKDEINEVFNYYSCNDSRKMMYFTNECYDGFPEVRDMRMGGLTSCNYAVVDDGKLVGFFRYSYEEALSRVNNFDAILFDMESSDEFYNFMASQLKSLYKEFHAIEITRVADDPSIFIWDVLCQECGGNKHVFRDKILEDHVFKDGVSTHKCTLHDRVIYEIINEEVEITEV